VILQSVTYVADNSGSSATEVRRFVDEALRMKEFDHPNVLSLIGVALDFDSLPLVVLPFMRHGDLLSYVRNESNVSFSTAVHVFSTCLGFNVHSTRRPSQPICTRFLRLGTGLATGDAGSNFRTMIIN